MNIYGERAMRHWQEWLPDEFAAIDDPATFFVEVGLWISDEVARIEFELLPPEYYSDDDFMRASGIAVWRGCAPRRWCCTLRCRRPT